MRQLILRLKAAWNFMRLFPVIDNLPLDFWTKDDRKRHGEYMTSQTGQKWIVLMRAFVQSAAFRATSERVYPATECGFASGVRAILAYNDALLPPISPAESVSRQNETPEEKELREILERYAP